MGCNIGFVSTRFAGNDGVSLESAKWAKVLWDHRNISYWYAGKLDRNTDISLQVPEAYFYDRDNIEINAEVFGRHTRSARITRLIYDKSDYLKRSIYEFVAKFGIEILIVENALSIPMHIPLGVALTNFIAETEFPTIAHHHDFYWERSRFMVNAVGDILSMAFPPSLPSIQHVTINSTARQDLSWRTGCSSVLVPNVLDFENPPPENEPYARSFRQDIGLDKDDILFLQPTRVVPRKGIEHSIGLVAQLKDPHCKLIVSHESGDEGHDYQNALKEIASQEKVDLRFIDSFVGDVRARGPGGKKIYTLEDVYSQADFITFPSLYEGFGNALLEAFYYRKPVLVNRYSIFINDIEPRGFRCVSMNGFLTRETVDSVRRVLDDKAHREEMVNHNYEQGKSFFSYSVLRRRLRSLVTNVTGLDEL